MTPDLLALLTAAAVTVIGCAVLVGYWLGRREAGPTVARLAGEIDRLERKLSLEAAANDRLAALVPRTLTVRDNRIGGLPVLEVNGVTVRPARVLECRDDVLLGRMAIAFQIEAGDWPVDELLAAVPTDVGPFATAGLTRLRGLLAEQLTDRATQPTAQPVS